MHIILDLRNRAYYPIVLPISSSSSYSILSHHEIQPQATAANARSAMRRVMRAAIGSAVLLTSSGKWCLAKQKNWRSEVSYTSM